MSIVAPSYSAGQAAVLRLRSGESIQPDDEGFQELGEILLAPLRPNHPPDVFESVLIVKISPKKLSRVTLSGVVQKFDLGVDSTFSDGQDSSVGTRPAGRPAGTRSLVLAA